MSTQAPEAPVVPAPEPATAPPAATVPVPSPPPAPAEDTTDWKAEAERWKAQARTNEQRSKANHQDVQKRDDLLKQVAEQLGIPFEGKPDPSVLTSRLEEQTRLARSRSVELAVFHAATGTVDASALLDSRGFMDQAAQLDPDALDFRARVGELVAEAAKQPRYQFTGPQSAAMPAQQQAPSGPPAAASGADFSGAPGGNRLWTEADYANWKASGQDEGVLNKAIDDGLLVNLGVGRRRNRSTHR